MIRVVVSGTGNMGQTVLVAVKAQEDMEIVGVLAPRSAPGDYRAISGSVYPQYADPVELFGEVQAEVVVDFTHASFTRKLVEAALAAGVRPVIGTSGISPETTECLRSGCAEQGFGAIVAPNFALGAVLLMHVAEILSQHFTAAEIIDLHHPGKADAPSGTALETARRMRAARGADFDHPEPELMHIEGTRGGVEGGVGLHSVRLPGLVAHQEVIFGGLGQTLTLRHDSMGRESFMPGVLLAIREVMERNELVLGLDELLGLT